MLKRIFRSLATTITTIVLVSPGVAVGLTPSQTAVCNGSGSTAAATSCNNSGPSVPTIIKNAINVFSVIIGLIAVVMVMVSGLKYMTSQGDANAVASAKNTLIYAIIGIVIAVLAQVIVKYVLNRTA